MPRGTPSLIALLGLLAVAGYQNRDKISEALGGLAGGGASTPGGRSPGSLGGLPGGLENIFGGAAGGQGGLGGFLSGLGGSGGLAGGLGELLNSFQAAGHGGAADSWVNPAVPTQGLTPEQVQQAIGEENLNELTQRTGLSRDDLLKRLSTAIPQTVDTLTPNGQMPTEEQVRQHLIPGQA